MYPDKKALVIHSEEAGEKNMGILRERHQPQEEGEKEEQDFRGLAECQRPASLSPYMS